MLSCFALIDIRIVFFFIARCLSEQGDGGRKYIMGLGRKMSTGNDQLTLVVNGLWKLNNVAVVVFQDAWHPSNRVRYPWAETDRIVGIFIIGLVFNGQENSKYSCIFCF